MTAHRNNGSKYEEELPPLERFEPSLPDLPVEPTDRELARGHANILLWIRQWWPSFLNRLDAIDRRQLRIEAQLDRIERRLVAAYVLPWYALGFSVLISATFAIAMLLRK